MKSIIREHIYKKFKRSKNWPRVRKIAIIRDNNECKSCCRKWGLQVHHIYPVHLYPELELDMNNLITLCSKCHFIIGHLSYWKSWNREVKEICEILYWKTKNRP